MKRLILLAILACAALACSPTSGSSEPTSGASAPAESVAPAESASTAP